MNEVKPDIIGLFSSTLVKAGRLALRHIGRQSDSHPGRIMLSWKRNDVCVETKERGKDNTSKEYPQLVSKGWNGHNRVFKYRIPTGLKHDKLIKSINDIEFDLKSEVLFKLLENDKKAHFSLTVLSGHLKDLITYTDEANHLKDKGLWIPLGWSRRGLEQLDLTSNNSPHLMIGGGTGAGKSILARLILTTLHIKYTRDEVRLWLCDLKHGNDTSMLGDDPVLVDKVIVGPEAVANTMDELSAIIGQRYEMFKTHKGCSDIKSFNKLYPTKRMPHIICFVDELTKLEGKEFREAREKMSKVTGEGRASGVHMIISCHRPTANLVSGTMKNNIPAVVAFRCNPVSARVLLGEDEWESSMMIDKDVEGRALFKFKDEVLIQVPYIDDEMVGSIMAAYQKPQRAQAELIDKIIKATKEPIDEGIIKKSRNRQLCERPTEETRSQRAKLRLVQPLGTKGIAKE
ncbi:MAG: FtsK/SpoIIIE domain-containing protein [Desulfosporosinus sp.]